MRIYEKAVAIEAGYPSVPSEIFPVKNMVVQCLRGNPCKEGRSQY